MEHRSSGHLLGRFSSHDSQEAFAGLVEQHIKLVYSTCYRELGQRELAEDATQEVFLALARRAGTIRSEAALVPWLYTTARFESRDLRRQEQRRMAREGLAAHEAIGMSEQLENDVWRGIEPALNDAISALSYSDQQAILLRFFEEKSLREVGQAIGANEDAARKRVARALEKLRGLLIKRNVATISTVALCALLTERATYAVPAQLTSDVAQSATLSLAPPVSGGVALFESRGGSLITKGLMIVSTYKIIAWSSATVVLLALLFLGGHWLRSVMGRGIQPVRHVVTKYGVTELGALPGYANIVPTWMNDTGDVVGGAADDNWSHARAFYYHDGKLSEIRSPGGCDVTYADYITNDGTIWVDAGGVRGTTVVLKGSKNRLSTYAVLPDPMSRRGGRFSEVDDEGAVFYCDHTGMNEFTVFTMADGKLSPLQKFGQCTNLFLTSMNDKGDIVGVYNSTLTGVEQPCVYSKGKLTILPKVAGAGICRPTAISDSGYIGGVWGSGMEARSLNSYLPARWLAWLYRDGSIENLGTLPGYTGSGVNAVNDAGVAVGFVHKENAPHRAVVFENGHAIDLNRLIDASPGLVLEHADFINDRGQILCDGQKAGKPIGVLLTPEG